MNAVREMATPQQKKSELVTCYNLTPAMLNRKVEDRDIAILERIIPTFGSIAPQLLSRVDQVEVDLDCRSEAQKKQRMLETWVDRNGDAATFDELITAMVEAELDQAAEVCKLLNPGQCEYEVLDFPLVLLQKVTATSCDARGREGVGGERK